jgi:hypothetical protein
MSKGESDVVADLKNHAATNRVAISEFLESTVRSYALHCWQSLLPCGKDWLSRRNAPNSRGEINAEHSRSRESATLFTHK